MVDRFIGIRTYLALRCRERDEVENTCSLTNVVAFTSKNLF